MAVTPFKSSDNFNMAGFNEKITEADNTYVAKTGDSMSGALSMGNNKITDVGSPVNDGDAVNKGYVDSRTSKWVKVSNLTLNNKASTSSQTPLGSFNTFSLDTINAVSSIRIKGIVNINNVRDSDKGAGLTLFGGFNGVCLHIVKYPDNVTVSFENFDIDLICPAVMVKGKDENNSIFKTIYVPMITMTSASSYTSRSFNGNSTPYIYNSDYTTPVSCNLDLYLEVVE